MHADLDALQLEVRSALHRQRPEHGAFGVDAGTVASVVATDDLGDEGPIGSEVVEVTGAAQQQGLFDGALEVAVGAFDAAVLVGLAAVVARGAHAIVVAQLLVAAGEIVSGGLIEVVVGGRQAVGTVLFRDRTEQPQGVLAAAAQGDEALAAEHYVSIFEARVGQPEVIQQMRQRHTADSDAEVSGGGEVGQGEATGWMLLGEDHLLFGPMQGTPPAHAALDGAAHAGRELSMTAAQFFEDGHRAQSRALDQQRHHFFLEDAFQRVGTAAAARRLLL